MIGTRPLTDEELERMRDAFSGPYSRRDLCLFVLGVNTGFRITELLSLDLRDVATKDGRVFNSITVRRVNTKGKHHSRCVKLSPEAKRTMEYWVACCHQDGYNNPSFSLFCSRKGLRLSRIQAWRVLRKAYAEAGIDGPVGTHSMRKTFANRIYTHFIERLACGERIDPFRLVSKALGHQRIENTEAYLSFRQDDIDKSIDRVGYG